MKNETLTLSLGKEAFPFKLNFLQLLHVNLGLSYSPISKNLALEALSLIPFASWYSVE